MCLDHRAPVTRQLLRCLVRKLHVDVVSQTSSIIIRGLNSRIVSPRCHFLLGASIMPGELDTSLSSW